MKYDNVKDFQKFINSTDSNKLIKFTNCYLCRNSELVLDDLWIKDRKIQDSEKLFFVDKLSPEIIIDCSGGIISPGFIDIQINGGYGYDFSDLSHDVGLSLKVVSGNLVKFGVTGFCPTLICATKDVYQYILSQHYDLPNGNSQIFGFHIEGPFLSKSKSGMHKKELIKNDFGVNPVETLLDMYGHNLDKVKYVTIAPELPNSCEAIKYLVDRGISVSLGHSAASFDEGVSAIECGANMLTHLFCSMNPFHHRDPHLVGLLTYDCAIPASPRLYYGIITDLIHTHATSIRIAHRANKDGLIVVSDANSAFGLSDGCYRFGNRDIEVINDKSFVKDTNILAGGTTALDQCMRNYWLAAGISRAEALDSVTCHPADALKIGDQKGRLEPGYDADFVILSYESMEVLSTWIAGEIVHLSLSGELNVEFC